MRLRLPLCLGLILLGLGAIPLDAQTTIVWSGATNRFILGSNWVGGSAPGGAHTAEFGNHGGVATIMVNSTTVGNLQFVSARTVPHIFSYDDGFAALTLNGNLTAQTGPNISFTPFLNLVLPTGEHVFDIGASTTVQISGVISGPGHFSKTGAGTLILTGANTFNYDGNWGFVNSSAIHNGTVQLNGGAINHGTSGDVMVGVGNGDTGTLNITAGADVSGYFGVLGQGANSIGVATVTGAGSTWTNAAGMDVGYSGSGTLTISASGQVSNNGATLGYASGASGTVLVTGPNSTWVNTAGMHVGDFGTGILAITAGGAVTNIYSYVGTQVNSLGTVTVDGAGSTWAHSGLLAVGQAGLGGLTISNGGQVSNSEGQIGYLPTATGTVTVTGATSVWTNSNSLTVGNAGGGTLLVSNGARVNVNGGAGTITLGESGGSGSLIIGATSPGGYLETATITTGSGTGSIIFATNATAGSPYFLTRNGSEFGSAINITGPTQIVNQGGYNVLNGVNSHTGSTIITGGTLVAGNNNAFGSGSVIVNGGTLGVADGVTFGNSLAFGVSGGTLTGKGTFSNPLTFGTGVTLAPGYSPGTLQFLSGLTLGGGGTYEWQTKAPIGTPGSDWDLLSITGALSITANSGNKYSLKVISLDLNDAPGAVDGLNAATSWIIASTTTGIAGFDPNAFLIDSSQFVGGGLFSLGTVGNDLVLNFTPVPEPSTSALLALGLAGGGLAAWRKRRRA